MNAILGFTDALGGVDGPLNATNGHSNGSSAGAATCSA